MQQGEEHSQLELELEGLSMEESQLSASWRRALNFKRSDSAGKYRGLRTIIVLLE